MGSLTVESAVEAKARATYTNDLRQHCQPHHLARHLTVGHQERLDWLRRARSRHQHTLAPNRGTLARL